MVHPSISISLLLAAVCLTSACSSSDAPADGAASDAAVAADVPKATDDAANAADAAPTPTDATADATPDTGTAPGGDACAYSTGGARTEPTTNALGCGGGYIKQTNGSGDYFLNIASGFEGSGGDTFNLGCAFSSASAPKAGDVWTFSKQATGSKCTLIVSNSTGGSQWEAATSGSGVTGSFSFTFVSATKAQGSIRPKDVYYTFDVTLDATLKASAAGGADMTVKGHFANSKLPLGA